MSKITFRADDTLVDELERFDASKSEVLRRALREYLEGRDGASAERSDRGVEGGSIDDIVAERVDTLVERRLAERTANGGGQDINVNISLDGDRAASEQSQAGARKTAAPDERDASDARDPAPDGSNTCGQCGENVSSDHVYCPNCGEKATHRVFCDCGDELRTDWAFCPSCGRRTPAADVLDSA
ncbi:zinc ribbon domain-containing protein [Halostella sp. PRR32]|uniref:double zinc ribbon domain-containing protein n=1 Tax=Halostella sp. PRR32 TaxID=3098147 RepID=UPI002B1E1841|nr:zinc ribbon domain-containing protein [Halostella sp. PRR32]